MFIESVPNRDSPPAVLLRESYRDENGRPQKRTLANLSKLPDHVVAALKAILKGGTLIGTGPNHLQVERSLPHGHVAAALGMIRKIALDRLILSTGQAKVRHDAVRPPAMPLGVRALVCNALPRFAGFPASSEGVS
jgi:hypothetical protein